MHSKVALLSAMPLVLCLASCATVIHGNSQELHFTSDPPGAQVFVNGEPVGFTPLLTSIPRGAETEVIYKKEGYEDRPVYLEYKLSPWFWGNVLLIGVGVLPGVAGIVVDNAFGGINDYDPIYYHFQMTSAKSDSPQPTSAKTDSKEGKIDTKSSTSLP